MKKTVAMLLAMLLALSCCAALAEDAPPPEQISPDLTFSFVSWINPISAGSLGLGDGIMLQGQDGLEITYTSAGISRNGSSGVKVTATTEANLTCGEIGGVMTIQKWYNNQWNFYHGISFVGYDRDSFSASKTVSVDSGYYYRLKVTHTADTLYSSRFAYSTTNSVFVQ